MKLLDTFSAVPPQDWIRFGFFFVGIFTFIAVAEKTRSALGWSPEVTRKLVHISTGFLIFFTPFFFTSNIPLIVMAILFIAVNYIGVRTGKLQGMHGTTRKSYGTVFYPLSFFVLVTLCWNAHKTLIMIPILILALADAGAAIVGENLKRPHSFLWGSDKKSVEGSVTMFFISFIVVFICLPLIGFIDGYDISWSHAAWIGLVTATVAMVLEAISSKGSDNLTAPLGAAFILHFMLTGSSSSSILLTAGLGPELAVENGFIETSEEYFTFNYMVSKEFTHKSVHEALSDREVLLIPAVQLLGDLDTILNSLSGRMREWYGVHFPEMGRRVRDHEDYANVITRLGERDNITTDALMKLTLKKKDAVKVEAAAEDSMGADIDEFDIKTIQSYTIHVLDMYKFREELSEYISTITREIAPNIAYLAGPVLAAKLIDKAGSMKRLAMIPASTIQVLGAEKAMFRAKKSNARPPKHGLLYQHPYVNSAPRDKRGSRARSLAAKIAIAARADLFSGDYIAEDLAAQLADF